MPYVVLACSLVQCMRGIVATYFGHKVVYHLHVMVTIVLIFLRCCMQMRWENFGLIWIRPQETVTTLDESFGAIFLVHGASYSSRSNSSDTASSKSVIEARDLAGVPFLLIFYHVDLVR